MPLLDTIQKDMVAAMKAKDEARLSAVRMIKTALKKVEVDSMKPLDEATEMQVLNSLIKQRTESADMFRKGVEARGGKFERRMNLLPRYIERRQQRASVYREIPCAAASVGHALDAGHFDQSRLPMLLPSFIPIPIDKPQPFVVTVRDRDPGVAFAPSLSKLDQTEVKPPLR